MVASFGRGGLRAGCWNNWPRRPVLLMERSRPIAVAERSSRTTARGDLPRQFAQLATGTRPADAWMACCSIWAVVAADRESRSAAQLRQDGPLACAWTRIPRKRGTVASRGIRKEIADGWDYGEEKLSRRSRSPSSPRDEQPLVPPRSCRADRLGGPRERQDQPGTRSFQAIRIVITASWSIWKPGRDAALGARKPGGRWR